MFVLLYIVFVYVQCVFSDTITTAIHVMSTNQSACACCTVDMAYQVLLASQGTVISVQDRSWLMILVLLVLSVAFNAIVLMLVLCDALQVNRTARDAKIAVAAAHHEQDLHLRLGRLRQFERDAQRSTQVQQTVAELERPRHTIDAEEEVDDEDENELEKQLHTTAPPPVTSISSSSNSNNSSDSSSSSSSSQTAHRLNKANKTKATRVQAMAASVAKAVRTTASAVVTQTQKQKQKQPVIADAEADQDDVELELGTDSVEN